MTETLLTKCPHCGTTFRLTQAQLDIAGGAVRCGACYQVFHASEHIVKTAVVEEIRTKPAPPRPDPVQEAFNLDSGKGLDPYDASAFALDTPDSDLFSEDYRASLDSEPDSDEFELPDTGSRKKKKGTDESWAEELLKELGEDEPDDDLIHDEAPVAGKKKAAPGAISSADNAFSLDDDDIAPAKPPKKKKSGDDLSDTFKTLGMFGSDDPFSISNIEEEEFGASNVSDDESWAKAMLDELEEDQNPRAKKKDEGLSILMEEPEKPEDRNPFAARELARTKREAVQRAKSEQVKQPKQKKVVREENEPEETSKPKDLRNSETEDFFRLLEEPLNAEPLPQAEPAPELEGLEDLEEDLKDTAVKPSKLFTDSEDIINRQVRLSALHYGDEEPEKRPLNTALMVLGSLILALVLAGQYVYFNFNDVALNPSLRPWLELVCKQAGCTLPSQSDLTKLSSSNLVVRSHPHERNALVVDAIIKNTADFEQPFPVIQLNFADINNTPLAKRRFQPREYITDTSIDIQRMPPNTPIHLTLEIVDPGKQAVNYQLEFLPANTPN